MTARQRRRLLPLDVLPAPVRVPLAIAMAMAGAPLAALGALGKGRPALAVALAVLLTPILTPLFTPLAAEVGLFRYWSRGLLTLPRGPRRLDLHLATRLDRVVHREALGGARLFVSVLDGLVALGEATRDGALAPDTELRGTSYFVAPRTARALGFAVRAPGLLARLVFLLGIVDAAVWLSLVARRPASPTRARS